jgi:hypothetical protein
MAYNGHLDTSDSCRSDSGHLNVGRLHRPSTHRSRRQFSQRTTGLLWNWTFAHAAEKVSDGGSGRSLVANTDRDRIPAEPQHPKAVY